MLDNMIISIYCIIIFGATVCGAIAGLGGGVIIKPLFDMIGVHDASSIGFYSSIAVFTMCIVSIYKQIKNGFGYDKTTVIYVSIGSFVGGLIGENIFNFLTLMLDNNRVKMLQAILLGITLIIILLYTLNKNIFPHFYIHNRLSIFSIGIFLGGISVFLGIGGGPLNVAVMMILFSYDMKEATIYSIATIFFSQVSKLGSVIISNTLFLYDISLVPFICISAIFGGYVGTVINQKLTSSNIEKIYNFLIIVLIAISCFNVFNNI